jgi:CRP/FNR family cyclic AMP-dependent transcriptional regulator
MTMKSAFDPKEFLAKVGVGKVVIEIQKSQTVFSQGDVADSVFYRAPRTMTILLLEISPLWHDARFHC